jgi:[ribosomal protein S5]-alanine N-acetyltransferase
MSLIISACSGSVTGWVHRSGDSSNQQPIVCSLIRAYPDASFATPRLLAEPLAKEHWEGLRRMDQDEHFMAFLGGVRDEAGTDRYLTSNLEHWEKHGFGLWMLRDRETGAMIGRAVLRHLMVDVTDEVETGYGFLPEFWGRGLATEITDACLRVGRERLGLDSIVGITRPANTASQRVMAKAGLTYEREIVHDGQLHFLFRHTFQ